MKVPEVSVLMPVYNIELYLREAIDSILQQTFTNFEFIIVNDGSTDRTEEIVLSYKDERIRYYRNDKNSGVIYTLDRAMHLSKGKYLARMDGDDISLPDRLQKQYDYMQKNNCDVVASCVQLIDKDGKDIGYWDEDKKNISAKAIKNYLPINNCIAHPTVMMKSEILKKYKYNPKQRHNEDYDLWLRIIADGGSIQKIEEPLLMHRYLQTSVTRTRKINVFFNLMIVKFVFVKQQLQHGSLSGFVLKTFFFSLVDGCKGIAKFIKQKLVS